VGTFIVIDPVDIGCAAMYDVLVACIQPRPIAFVSTLSPDGQPNLAPFSFFMPGGANPPSLAISVTLAGGGRRKDTLRNIEMTGEFVINLVTREMAPGMNQTSYSFPEDVSEWPHSGFESLPSELVAPSRVAISPAQFECRLFQVVQHGSDGGAAVYIIGEVLRAHVRQDLWSADGAHLVRPIARLGGPNYLDLATASVFQMERP
jgi:flavin reductase (DIM6/NTAB) family NADH-FMN oxidoreductase RutF